MKYKVKPEYLQAANDIIDDGWVKEREFVKDSYTYEQFKTIGILDKWCEEIVEYKVGDWICDAHGGIAQITKITGTRYGISNSKNWKNGYSLTYGFDRDSCLFANIRPATPEEIESVTKPKLEIGKWYFVNNYCPKDLLIYHSGEDVTYGFNGDGKWSNKIGSIGSDQNFRLATKEEVQSALVKEAEKRGFKNGTKFISAGTGVNHKYTFGNPWFNESPNDLSKMWSTLGGFVFYNGKWAEIISEPELPEINGYKGEYNKNTDLIKYGCATLHAQWFRSTDNRSIDSIFLSSGVTINQQQVKQIREYLEQVG